LQEIKRLNDFIFQHNIATNNHILNETYSSEKIDINTIKNVTLNENNDFLIKE